MHKQAPQKIENRAKEQVRKCTVLLVGDSHIKGLSSEQTDIR
jgi:hypothetical protein